MPYIRLSVRACALTAMALGGTIAFPPQSYAQNTEVTTRQFSAKAGGLVLEAQNLLTVEQYEAALAKLSIASALSDLSAYEKAVIYQMQGTSLYALNRFSPAIAALENALNSGGLNMSERNDLDVKIAQLLIVNGRSREGAEKLEKYLGAGGTFKAEYAQLLTQAWIEVKAHDRALPWAQKWFDAASPKERKHYDLLNFLYNKLGQSGRQAALVKNMIQRWPQDKDLWTAWTSLLSNAGQDDDAFAVSKLLYLGGAVTTEPEILKVVQYYSYYDMPYEAAQILEKEINVGRVSQAPETLLQLATLFRQAREYGRAIPVLEAVTQSQASAKSYAQLGEALYNEGRCQRAEAAFKQGIDRGYDAGKAWTLIATCRYEQVQQEAKLNCDMTATEKSTAPKTKARQSAIAAFENVPPTAKEARDAQKWISFIKAERDTFDRQCAFKERVKKEECMKDIRRAYSGVFIDNQLTISTECKPYKQEYDTLYRVKTTG